MMNDIKQYDNMTSQDIENILKSAKKMGIDKSISDENIIDSLNNPIFNKENDLIIEREYIEKIDE